MCKFINRLLINHYFTYYIGITKAAKLVNIMLVRWD
jgi:hypothetical protein